FKFDTLEELAEGMGIDKAGLLREIEYFNANAKAGYDPDYHRGESMNIYESAKLMASFNPFSVASGNLDMLKDPASVLAPIEEGPYYCVRYVPGSLCTRGGMQVNEKAQVENVDGDVIPGLYAVGNCSTGIAGYWAGGANISQGTVMSYIAAKAIME
ncbi:MAG: FAD-binding protein, partial [Oscillospiraceae bacterium]|nr:FAD-binding protein [Oscillospiraceae bacterium]